MEHQAEEQNQNPGISIEEYLKKRKEIRNCKKSKRNTFGWEYLNDPNLFRLSERSLL